MQKVYERFGGFRKGLLHVQPAQLLADTENQPLLSGLSHRRGT